MTAVCSKCGTRPRSTSHSWCLICKKEERDGRRNRNREYVYEYLRTHPCVDCGESDPICLSFDHNDGETKLDTVADLILHGSLEALIIEISKATVRCHNDHAKKTAKDFGQYKYRMGVASWSIAASTSSVSAPARSRCT